MGDAHTTEVNLETEKERGWWRVYCGIRRRGDVPFVRGWAVFTKGSFVVYPAALERDALELFSFSYSIPG